MDSSDDEYSDQWVEMDDKYDTDDQFEDEILGDRLSPKEKSSDDDTESDTNDGDEENDHNKLKSNTGWADAMAKILKSKKPQNSKIVVLSKAKKIKDVKPKKPKLDFEIVGAENEENQSPDDAEEMKPAVGKKLMIKEYQAKGRVKPSILDKDRERTLIKIATKGVVQLFNAVRMQQKTVDKTLKKAGKSEIRREKMLETIDKKKFLDVLTGSVKSIGVDNEIKSEEIPEKQMDSWSVLRDDFMMGAKLKDWDKQDSS